MQWNAMQSDLQPRALQCSRPSLNSNIHIFHLFWHAPCAPCPVQSVSLLRAKLAHRHDALVVQARDGRRMLGVADRYESGNYFEVLGNSSTPGHSFAISRIEFTALDWSAPSDIGFQTMMISVCARVHNTKSGTAHSVAVFAPFD